MDDLLNQRGGAAPAARNRAAIAGQDAGLRRHMLAVFQTMGVGLLLSGAVAWSVAATPALYQPIFGTPLKWVAMFAPLAFVMFLSFRMDRMTLGGARLAFYSFAAVMGVSLASVFLAFTTASIAQTFFVAAIAFLGTALWGYTTKRDLSRFGTFLVIGLIGVVAASLVNVFLASGPLQLVISIVGVLVFAGLTAWDMQRAREEYHAYRGTEQIAKLAVMSALSLYLNFVNMFQLLLGLFGEKEG